MTPEDIYNLTSNRSYYYFDTSFAFPNIRCNNIYNNHRIMHHEITYDVIENLYIGIAYYTIDGIPFLIEKTVEGEVELICTDSLLYKEAEDYLIILNSNNISFSNRHEETLLIDEFFHQSTSTCINIEDVVLFNNIRHIGDVVYVKIELINKQPVIVRCEIIEIKNQLSMTNTYRGKILNYLHDFEEFHLGSYPIIFGQKDILNG